MRGASRTLRTVIGANQAQSPAPFFLMVFVLAVPFWVIGLYVDVQPLPGLPIAAGMFVCPALAALFLTYRERGTSGMVALLTRVFDGAQIRLRWYPLILLLMPAVAVASFVFLRWTGAAVPVPRLAPLPALGLFLAFLIGAVGEELGWTGYALDRLQSRLGALSSALVLGVIWAIWHWIALVQAHRSSTWIAWWTLGVVAARIIMVWTYNQTGKKLFGILLLHAMSNVCWQLFPIHGSLFDPRVNCLILSLIAVAAIVVRRQGGRPTVRPARPEPAGAGRRASPVRDRTEQPGRAAGE